MSENKMADLWKDLYENAADRSANFAGELGGMAFTLQALLVSAKAYDLGENGELEKVFEQAEQVLRKYYTGHGSESPFASLWQDSFEAGIESGMKEAA